MEKARKNTSRTIFVIKVGGWGRYQMRLLLFLFMVVFFVTYAIHSPVLVLYVPPGKNTVRCCCCCCCCCCFSPPLDHRCELDPTLVDLAAEANLTLNQLLAAAIPDGSKCRQYDVDFGKVTRKKKMRSITLPCGSLRIHFVHSFQQKNWHRSSRTVRLR